jgi:hypothetical protein
MKSSWRLLVALAAVLFTAGCETYRNSALTPDGFNYTLERDRNTGNMADYIGFTWKLK